MGVVVANNEVGLQRLWVTGVKQHPLQMWVHVTGVKGSMQMLRDLFEVFTQCVCFGVLVVGVERRMGREVELDVGKM
jgi:hypothetical protein